MSFQPGKLARPEGPGFCKFFICTKVEKILIFSCLGKHAVAKNSEERIPLLESVFKAFPQQPINIDIKDNDDELIDKV